MHTKYAFKKTIRIDDHLKAIIENNFGEVCRRTGLRLSYGKIARAFWITLAENPKLRKKCMEAVCKALLKEANKKESVRLGKRKT